MSEIPTSLIERIRSRGHWRVVIRPTRFVEKLIPSVVDLFPIVQKSAVELRGWDFPHIAQNQRPHIDIDWVGQEFEWQHYLEIWRFYQSGQFVHVSGMFDDWRDQSELWNRPLPANWQPGADMPFTNTVWRFTEIFEFASRLAASDAYSAVDRVQVEIVLSRLQGRRLYVDAPRKTPFLNNYQATLNELPFSAEYNREDLIAESRKLALPPASELFQRFGYNPPLAMVEEVQAGLYRPLG